MVYRGFTNINIKSAMTARQSLHQKYEQYKRENRQLIPLTDLYRLCWWAAGWQGRGHIWSLGVIALPCLRLPIQLKVEAGLVDDLQVRVWQWSDVFSGRTTRGFTFSHNSTFMAGSQKNNLPDHYNCYNCYLKQTQDYLSNSCDAMPKCVVMIIIVSGQMLRVLTGLLWSLIVIVWIILELH